LRWLRHRNQQKDKWLFGLTPLIATTIGTIITGIIGITIIRTIDRTLAEGEEWPRSTLLLRGFLC
jgi:hypothetical protein